MRNILRLKKHLLVFTLITVTVPFIADFVPLTDVITSPAKLNFQPLGKLDETGDFREEFRGHPPTQTLRQQIHLNVDSNPSDIRKQYRMQLEAFLGNRLPGIQEDVKGLGNNQIEELYRGRRHLVERVCQERNITIDFRTQLMHIKNATAVYCPVAKVGSTFLLRALSVIDNKVPNITSPFHIQYDKPPHMRIPLDKNTWENKHFQLLNSEMKFLFVRDPYHRVFSTYVDKLLSPNSYMWSLGSAAIHKFRLPEVKGKTPPGASVRFDEFVKFIKSQDIRHMNQHVKPVSYTCDLCGVKFDIIGKVETFEQDVTYILKKTGVYNDLRIYDMKLEKDLDQLVGNVLRTFMIRSWMESISFHAGMQRLWRQLQINGLIDMTDRYPLSPQQSLNVTVVDYVNMALDAFRRSSPAAKKNKREAYLQAYSMLQPRDLEELRQRFLPDFEMFDYEQRPAELFNMDRNGTWEYDYFDVMQLK